MPDADFEDAFRSHHHAEKTTDEPCVRVMALHALPARPLPRTRKPLPG